MNREQRQMIRALRPAPVYRPSFGRALAGWVWRHIAELLVLVLLGWAWHWSTSQVGPHETTAAALILILIVAAVPSLRRVVVALLWCSVTHHRLHTGLVEVRATTRDGRLPLFLSVAPAPFAGRRKIGPESGALPIVVVFDELAYFSGTVGDRKQQNEFTTAVRDLVARGRAAGVIVVAATQRPSADIIPTSLRDLFGYRWAFRCTTPASSDVVLGHGWAGQGYSATDIDPGTRGVGWLLAEGGIPRRMRAAYLSDDQVRELAAVAARRRAAARDAA